MRRGIERDEETGKGGRWEVGGWTEAGGWTEGELMDEGRESKGGTEGAGMDEDDGRGHCNLTRPSAHLPPMPGPFSHGAGAAPLVHGMRVRSVDGMDGRDECPCGCRTSMT